MIRPITITAVLNGYLVSVGCQTIVFNSTPDMLKELDLYLDKPEETEERYRLRALNSGKLGKDEIPTARAPRPTAYAQATANEQPQQEIRPR